MPPLHLARRRRRGSPYRTGPPAGLLQANINMRQNYTQYNGQDAIPVGTLCHEETLG